MNDVVIVAAQRTAIGAFGGMFKEKSAVDLGADLLRATLGQIELDPEQVDEVIIGNVLGAGLGQNVARQVAVKAGLPVHVPAFTVNKVCGSGLKAVTLAAQAIKAGDAEVVVAGGTENMSQAPYIQTGARWGQRMGDARLVDTLLKDGLTDAFSQEHMGLTAEYLAEAHDITREQQDTLAAQSQQKAEAAIQAGKFKAEILPIEVPQARGESQLVDQDEYPRAGTTLERLAQLKPAFKKEAGTVTAGSSSGINDGAAILILMREAKAVELGLPVLARIRAYASAGVEPQLMGAGPIPATQKALAKAGLSVADLGRVEANEAFASQAFHVIQTLGIDPDIVNVNGGSIALGHPIGASGARILVTLVHEMRRSKVQYGLATLCIGGGQGIAMVVEQ